MLFNILDRYDKGRPSVVALKIYFLFYGYRSIDPYFLYTKQKTYSSSVL